MYAHTYVNGYTGGIFDLTSHNGLKHICAQIGRVPRKLSPPWDRGRLAAQTIAFLRDEGARVHQHLITHVFPFHDAQEAFELVAENGKRALQVVLRCE